MTLFIVRSIQDAHGDLNPDMSSHLWPKEEWPPLTDLGVELKEQLEGDSYESVELIRHIKNEADGNIGCAKMLLETACLAESMQDVLIRRSYDRIHPRFVSFFDDAVDEIQKQDKQTSELAIKVMKLVSNTVNVGMSYTSIKGELIDLPPFTMREVLHAAKGFLTATMLRQKDEDGIVFIEDYILKPYIIYFGVYIYDDYNNNLRSS
jgi:hypothetical protein